MADLIDDRVVDALQIIWEQSPGYIGPRVVDAPPQLRMLRDFLSREIWQCFVKFILPGALQRHGRVVEHSGFRFRGDFAPDHQPFEGVEMFDRIETIHLSERAFDRMMSRYLEVIIQGVTTHQRPEMREDWWRGLVASARVIEERLHIA